MGDARHPPQPTAPGLGLQSSRLPWPATGCRHKGLLTDGEAPAIYVCAYLYIYIYVCVCVCVFIYVVYAYVCICIHRYIYIYAYIQRPFFTAVKITGARPLAGICAAWRWCPTRQEVPTHLEFDFGVCRVVVTMHMAERNRISRGLLQVMGLKVKRQRGLQRNIPLRPILKD